MNSLRSILARVAVPRADGRAALVGLLGGGLLAIMVSRGGAPASMGNQAASRRPTSGAEGWTGRPGQYLRDVVETLSWLDVVLWGEPWVPLEWRTWTRPGDDLSWPPPEEQWECPPGAHCCPMPPETICDPDPARWQSSTPPCPFEPAPIAELPAGVQNARGNPAIPQSKQQDVRVIQPQLP